LNEYPAFHKRGALSKIYYATIVLFSVGVTFAYIVTLELRVFIFVFYRKYSGKNSVSLQIGSSFTFPSPTVELLAPLLYVLQLTPSQMAGKLFAERRQAASAFSTGYMGFKYCTAHH